MDTNKDGRLNLLDDPYTPYYPGDEYVDWIGLSVYWFGYRQGENALPIGNHFEALIHGTSEWSIQGGQPVWDFYAMFPNKPFGIPETGVAFYVNSPPGPGELAMKRAWWNMTLTSKPWTRMQRLQMIGWFEEDKTEERGAVSYAVSFNSTIKTAFLDGLPEMREGGDLAYSCDGTIGLASAAAQTSEGPTGPVRNGRSGR